MSKYKAYFNRMVDENKELFTEFGEIHESYLLDPNGAQEEFNRVGDQVLTIIREWEERLCQQSERSQFGKYSSNLSEKFWDEIRTDYPKIDFIGVKLE